MKYMVMECHLSYAVVLDESGRFLNVANMHYEVGQTVTQVVELTPPKDNASAKRIRSYQGYTFAALAACLLLAIAFIFLPRNAPYASIYMSINPQVRIDVNRRDDVVGLEGMNEDGNSLISGYSYSEKKLEQVMDELVDLSINLGHLFTGGKIILTLDAESNQWITEKEASLGTWLEEQIPAEMSVTVEVTRQSETPVSTDDPQPQPDSEPEQLYIPPVSQENPAEDVYGDSAYGNEPLPSQEAPASSNKPSSGQVPLEQQPSQPQAPAPQQTQQSAPQPQQSAPQQQAPAVNNGDSGYDSDSGYDGGSGYDGSS